MYLLQTLLQMDNFSVETHETTYQTKQKHYLYVLKNLFYHRKFFTTVISFLYFD